MFPLVPLFSHAKISKPSGRLRLRASPLNRSGMRVKYPLAAYWSANNFEFCQIPMTSGRNRIAVSLCTVLPVGSATVVSQLLLIFEVEISTAK